jgi:GT2 family glycosyltransferase
VIVVDNDSTDGSDRIDVDIPNLLLVRAGGNLGFARACNLGVTHSTSDYLLFLNPDARLLQPCLPELTEFMDRPQNQRVAVCGVRLIDAEGNLQACVARFPDWRTYLGHATGLSRLIPSLLPPLWAQRDYSRSGEIDQPIGAFFLARAATFRELGCFDERFYVYFEEMDYSLRVATSGYKAYYRADVVAFHQGGGTSRRVKAARLFYFNRSKLLYAWKNFSTIEAAAVIAITLVVEPVGRLGRALLRRSASEFVDVLRGYGRLYRDLPSLRRGRRLGPPSVLARELPTKIS